MRNGLLVAVLVVVTWSGWLIWDRVRLNGRATACERAGGVYVVGMSEFVCATARREVGHGR